MTDSVDPRRAAAVEAAIEAAARYGYGAGDPSVIQETNNVVVWLRPHDVIAKVGRWSHSVEPLIREHSVATVLAASGAPIASPLPRTEPVRDQATGFVVTLWERLEADVRAEFDPVDVGESLRALHAHLDRYHGELPSFRDSIALARRKLEEEDAIPALAVEDRAILRRAIDTLSSRVDAFHAVERPLHGEPHGANLLSTRAGLRWIDLEGACVGPLEWDLAFLSDEADEVFDGVNQELLGLLRTLNSARTATWCWARADLEEMLWHARHHLDVVKASLN